MNASLLSQIDKLIDSARADLARTTIELTNIKSVQSEPMPGAPFGNGPRKVLETVLEMGQEAGFHCTDHGVGVISLAMQEGQPDLGIWLHGDVVPEGEGWRFEPYNAVEYEGCIIGRGATDNKGQLAVIFHLLKMFKELGIKLKYNPALYVGSNEETGMKDMVGLPGNDDAKGFINVCTPPRLSLVPDGGFPIGYGGKGGMTLRLKSKAPLHGITLTAGLPETPGRATAIFDDKTVLPPLPMCTVSGATVTAETPPRHGAHPDPNGNMITNLSAALLEADLVEDDRTVFEFLKIVSKEIHGHTLGIATTHTEMSPLTVFAHRITQENGHIILSLNIRYPLGITYEEIVKRVSLAAEKYGFDLYDSTSGTVPYINDSHSPIVQTLCAVANGVTGDEGKPYLMSGGTYAHRLPNAFVYGMSGNLPPTDFPEGRGGAHGIDEAVSLDRLQRAMRIYARALLSLNELDW
ncbi:MAG: M20/M25/M40 family metallo-hydrolase [Clostridia bacterium]|nr:M20/M25/M40 family metallo-hydrolase [Clostridia bacterium]